MVVMAGCFPLQIILRKTEIIRITDDTAVFYAAGREHLHDFLAVRAVRITHAAHRIAAGRFQRFPVLDDLLYHLGKRASLYSRMRIGMTGYLMAFVEFFYFIKWNPGKRPHFAEQAVSVDMEGSFDAIFIKKRHEPPVIDFTIVIAHCQHFVLSAGKAGVDD